MGMSVICLLGLSFLNWTVGVTVFLLSDVNNHLFCSAVCLPQVIILPLLKFRFINGTCTLVNVNEQIKEDTIVSQCEVHRWKRKELTCAVSKIHLLNIRKSHGVGSGKVAFYICPNVDMHVLPQPPVPSNILFNGIPCDYCLKIQAWIKYVTRTQALSPQNNKVKQALITAGDVKPH